MERVWPGWHKTRMERREGFGACTEYLLILPSSSASKQNGPDRRNCRMTACIHTYIYIYIYIYMYTTPITSNPLEGVTRHADICEPLVAGFELYLQSTSTADASGAKALAYQSHHIGGSQRGHFRVLRSPSLSTPGRMQKLISLQSPASISTGADTIYIQEEENRKVQNRLQPDTARSQSPWCLGTRRDTNY